jgi:TolB-like protein
MKIYLAIFLTLIGMSYLSGQSSKVAILDFENTSGKTEYDALGKAISSMLITDLANNIHPKKVEFFERSQLNKLLDEQKLQKSKNFDAKTAVDFGKLSGVNYVFVGSVFVMDGTCNFSSKLVDVQTSKILLAKDVSGKIEAWLQLKTQLAESIANQLNNPITVESAYKDHATSLVTLNQYGKILTTMDGGDVDKAEQLRSVFQETTPAFKYFDDIKDDIEKLKQRVSELENVTDILTDAFELGDKAVVKEDFVSAIKYFDKFIKNPGNKGYIENKKLYAYSKMALSQYYIGDYSNALENSIKAQLIYKYYPEANEIELMSLIKLDYKNESKVKYYFIIDSLSYWAERKFIEHNQNSALIWHYSGFNGVNRCLTPDELSETMLYDGISKYGYKDNVTNEMKLDKKLKEVSLRIKFKKKTNKYEEIESKLMNYNDPLLFSTSRMVSFYNLSLAYAEELYEAGETKNYQKHLEKEIKRMQDFGIECTSCIDSQRIPISQFGDGKEKWIETEKIFRNLEYTLEDAGWDVFDSDFTFIYGQFLFKYLILLIKENQIQEAAALYRNILKTEVVNERDSYFNNTYWDILLGLRDINQSNSIFPLSKLEFEKIIDLKIENELKNINVPISSFKNIKEFKIQNNTGKLDVEIDSTIIITNIDISRNIGIIEDAIGNKFKFVDSSEEAWALMDDSIPGYCYYLFDESNGLKYGKMYNYWALKILAESPPKGWRVPSIKDYYNWVGLEDFKDILLKIKENEINFDTLKFNMSSSSFYVSYNKNRKLDQKHNLFLLYFESDNFSQNLGLFNYSNEIDSEDLVKKFDHFLNIESKSVVLEDIDLGIFITRLVNMGIIYLYTDLINIDSTITDDELMEKWNILYAGLFKDKINNLKAGGVWTGRSFCCIDEQAGYWTIDALSEPFDKGKFFVFNDGTVGLDNYTRVGATNLKDCFYSIRLVKEK